MISTGPIWVAAALGVVGASLIGLVRLVRSWHRLPLPLAAALALSLLVSFEAILLNGLSLFHAVSRPTVLLGHCLIPAGMLVAARGELVQLLSGLIHWRPRRRHIFLLPLVPLAALVVTSAVRYAPNNWDSMTYHLARVAHWMQNHSVAAYPTNICRQILLTPGAEYLLLSLQVISGTDRLANLLQFGCFLLVATAAPALARLAGAPLALARWAWLLPAAAPMMTLQASSTQNDLVAAATAVGLVAACLPYFHSHRESNDSRVGAVLLASAFAAAVLVKITALIAAAPFLFVVIGGLVVCGPRAKRAQRLLLMVIVFAIVIGPEIARRVNLSSPSWIVATFSYPLWGEWHDRLLNLGRGIWRHIPPPRAVVDLLAPFPHRGCGPHDSFCTLALRPQEDNAGNPFQVLLILILMAMAIVRWQSVPRRARYAVTAIVGGYVLLQLALRDNEWISRLHLPLFALAPVVLAVWPRSIRWSTSPRWGRAALAVVGLTLFGHGCMAAMENEVRMPLWSRPIAYRPSYYNNRWPARFGHDATLNRLQATSCRRLGLFIGEDSYDYPLTWRAMQIGIAVRHVTGQDDWPCAIFSDRGPPPGTSSALWTVFEKLPEGAEPASLYMKRSGEP